MLVAIVLLLAALTVWTAANGFLFPSSGGIPTPAPPPPAAPLAGLSSLAENHFAGLSSQVESAFAGLSSQKPTCPREPLNLPDPEEIRDALLAITVAPSVAQWWRDAKEDPALEKYSCREGCSLELVNMLNQNYSHLFKSSADIEKSNYCEQTRTRRSTDNDRCCPTKTHFTAYGYDRLDCHPTDYETNGLCCVMSLPNSYQVAHVGRCKKRGSSCDGGHGKCRQRYKYVTFLCQRVDPGHYFEFRYFRVQSHCSCIHS